MDDWEMLIIAMFTTAILFALALLVLVIFDSRKTFSKETDIEHWLENGERHDNT